MALVIVVVLIIVISLILFRSDNQSNSNGNGTGLLASLGTSAPNSVFALQNGGVANLSQYRGKAVLLWFVSTWCSSCAQGNEAINQNIGFFDSRNVTLIEVETYNNLGYTGPTMESFVSEYAPRAYANNSITIGYSSYGMMSAYDSKGYPDIYYLIAKNGTIAYINGSPGATMSDLMNAINKL